MNSTVLVAYDKNSIMEINLEGNYLCPFNKYAIIRSKTKGPTFISSCCGSILVNVELSCSWLSRGFWYALISQVWYVHIIYEAWTFTNWQLIKFTYGGPLGNFICFTLLLLSLSERLCQGLLGTLYHNWSNMKQYCFLKFVHFPLWTTPLMTSTFMKWIYLLMGHQRVGWCRVFGSRMCYICNFSEDIDPDESWPAMSLPSGEGRGGVNPSPIY